MTGGRDPCSLHLLLGGLLWLLQPKVWWHWLLSLAGKGRIAPFWWMLDVLGNVQSQQPHSNGFSGPHCVSRKIPGRNLEPLWRRMCSQLLERKFSEATTGNCIGDSNEGRKAFLQLIAHRILDCLKYNTHWNNWVNPCLLILYIDLLTLDILLSVLFTQLSFDVGMDSKSSPRSVMALSVTWHNQFPLVFLFLKLLSTCFYIMLLEFRVYTVKFSFFNHQAST